MNVEKYKPDQIRFEIFEMTLSMQFQASNFSHFMAYNLSKFFQLQILIGNIVVVFESIKIDKITCQQQCDDLYWKASLPTIHYLTSIQKRDLRTCFDKFLNRSRLSRRLIISSLMKAGLSDVFQNSTIEAEFFIDGAYDFKDRIWKSGQETIDDSYWIQSGDFPYPILLDRIAFVKSRTSSISSMIKDIGMDDKNSNSSKMSP